MIILESISSFKLPIKSNTCAWIVTSNAVVGSSAMITFGSHAKAIAMMIL